MTWKSSTITDDTAQPKEGFKMAILFDPPIHPGEILREEYLAPLGLSAGALAKKLRVPRTYDLANEAPVLAAELEQIEVMAA